VEWLNYHHLLYFWVVAREGSIARASAELRLAQPTISAQLRALEASLGQQLFTRTGRQLELTEAGRTVLGYADQIFGLGHELLDTLKGRPAGRPMPLVIGIAESVSRWIARSVVTAAVRARQGARVVCRYDRPERLMAKLAEQSMDLVVADGPPGPIGEIRPSSALLSESGLTFLAAPALAIARERFPASLDGAPMLLPAEGTSVRQALDTWFLAREIRPVVVGEFEDLSLLEAAGAAGLGAIAVPAPVAAGIARSLGLSTVGTSTELIVRTYAIWLERKARQALVAQVVEAGRRALADDAAAAAAAAAAPAADGPLTGGGRIM
jgi:LysR family transcriptional activator of nhaA